MSQINIENLLRLGEQPIDIPQVQPAAPDYRSSEFSGGGFQVGAPSRSVGPSSEEAMFGALREIAGGLKTGIDVFSSIRSQVEKSEIDKAKVKFKEIFAGDYTESKDVDGNIVRSYNNPEEKLNAWNSYIKDIWTPLMGDTWIKDLNIDAYGAFGNRDAQNKFEEERYKRVRTKYLYDNPQLGNGESESAIELFNEEYKKQYPTALENQWFQYTYAKGKSDLAAKRDQDAITNLNISLNRIIPIPSESELEAALNKTAVGREVRANYPVFFNLVENDLFKSREQIREQLLTLFQDELIAKNPEKYQPHTLSVLAQLLPTEATRYSEKLFQATTSARRFDAKQTANTRLATSLLSLSTTKDPWNESVLYLQTVAQNAAEAELGADKQYQLGIELIGNIWNVWDDAVLNGNGQDILSQYPNWPNLSPYEQLSIVSGFVQNQARTIDFSNAFGVARYQVNDVLANGQSGAAVLSQAFKKKLADWAVKNTNQSRANVDTIGLIVDSDALNQFTNNSIDSLAERTGLNRGEFRSIYAEFDEKQSVKGFKANINLTNWYDNQSIETKKKLESRGITRGNINNLENDILLAQQIEKAAIAQAQKIEGQDSEGALTNEQLESLAKSMQKFSPTLDASSMQNNGYIVNGLVTGTFNKTQEDQKYLNLVRETFNAQKVLAGIPESSFDSNGQPIIEKLTPQQKNAIVYLQQTSQIRAALTDSNGNSLFDEHIKAVGRLELQVRSLAPKFLRSLPGSRGLTGDALQTYSNQLEEDLSRIADDLIFGRTPLFDGRIPQNAFQNGDFTYNGRRFLVQSTLAGSILPFSSSNDDQRQFGDVFKQMFMSLGNIDDVNEMVRDPQRMLALMGLHSMSLEFKKAYEANGSVIAGNAAYATTRLLMLGNAAEDTNPEDIPKFFLESDFQEKASLALMMPLVVAKLQVGDIEAPQLIERGGTTGGAAFQMPIRSMPVIQALASLGAQFPPEIAAAINQLEPGQTIPITGNEGLTPYDPTWSVENFVNTWKTSGLFGKDDSTAAIADAMNMALLRGSIDPTNPPLSHEETIRRGAIMLYEISKNNQRLLSYTLEGFLGPIGQHPLFKPNGAETTSGNLLGFVGSALDVDLITRNPQFVAESYSVQDTPFNKQYIEDRPGVFRPFYAVYNENPNNSYNNFNLVEVLSPMAESTPEKFGPETLQIVVDKYKPNQTREETSNGMAFKVGSLLLESKPSDRAFIKAINPWLKAHGYNEYISPQTIATLPANYENDPALQAIRAVFNKTDLTFRERLELLNLEYVKRGGKQPIFNQANLNPDSPGFSTLTQGLNTGSYNSFIPSFNWIERDLNGVAMVSLSDGFFMEWKNSPNVFRHLEEEAKRRRKVDTAERDLENFEKAIESPTATFLPTGIGN